MLAFLLGVVIVILGAFALYLAGTIVYWILSFIIRCIAGIFGMD